MGLSGRKVKQRIPNDPRNLGWSDDAARFGSAYLSKFGWDPSKGLGTEGDGRTSHLKVAQKLDMLGIGAAHARDPNGIAWKQNSDFERLLARLNGDEDAAAMKVDGFARATEEMGTVAEVVDEEAEGRVRKEKKREEKKKRNAEEMENGSTAAVPAVEVVTLTTRVPPRGHRARHIRSKRLALTDSVAMAEVLGIAPTSSSTSIALARDSTSGSASATPVGVLEEIEKLTTSTKSVMDYFKEKLLAKSNAASESTTPSAADMDDDIAPRRGLGALNASSISMLSFVGAPQSTCESQTLPSSDAVVEPESAKKRKAVAVSFASAEGAQTTGEDDTAARKAAKRARKAAKQVAQATDEVILTTTSEAQAPIPYDSHPVDENLLEDDDPRAAAKRAHKKAKRLAKAAASSIPIESVTSQQESKEEKKRR